MPLVNTPLHRQNADHLYELYKAAFVGAPRRMEALFSSRSIDVDQSRADGWTLLRVASSEGHASVVSILLSKGANPSLASDEGITALHESATHGHHVVTKMLAKACAVADLSATTKQRGLTPLYLAAEKGHWQVMEALIEAGADPDSRTPTGQSALYTSAMNGHVDAVRVLLRNKANPLVPVANKYLGFSLLPLDAAAGAGHLDVVREMIKQRGIKGSSGATRGLNALLMASQEQQMDVVVFLVNAGVEDSKSRALLAAAESACEPAVKTLLQQRSRKSKRDLDAYINARDESGNTPLIKSILAPRFSSKVVRLLVDAGADTVSSSKIVSPNGEVCFNSTPLQLSTIYVYEKMASDEEGATEKRHRMEAIRRLLQRVEAVRAESWLWRSDVPCIDRAAEDTQGIKTAWVPSKIKPSVLRRTAGQRPALMAALFRYSGKP